MELGCITVIMNKDEENIVAYEHSYRIKNEGGSCSAVDYFDWEKFKAYHDKELVHKKSRKLIYMEEECKQ